MGAIAKSPKYKEKNFWKYYLKTNVMINLPINLMIFSIKLSYVEYREVTATLSIWNVQCLENISLVHYNLHKP